MSQTAISGQYVTCLDNPFMVGEQGAFHHEANGLILVEDGRITACGPYHEIAPMVAEDAEMITYDSDHVVVPGFLDTHVHYPQIQMTGAHGRHLVDWLNEYTYPAEMQFADKAYARRIAREFLRNCLKAGTTTALVHCTVFKDSVDAFFEESEILRTRMIAGKVMMDRNAPASLTDTPQSSYDDSLELATRWHGRGRQLYCITPRFAPTSTPGQLEAAGALWKDHPEFYLQTHLSETVQEIDWVRSLFPDRLGNFDVYEHFGLAGPRAVFGHCVHLADDERRRLFATGSAISHCPTSNLFLGSGLFDIGDGKANGEAARIGIGTDLGAGTSFCQLVTLNEAYKVAMLHNNPVLDSVHALYLATRGGAYSVYLDDTVGSIAAGAEADLVVLDLRSTEYLSFRMSYAKDIKEVLFLQMACADDRAVSATYVAGELLYRRDRYQREGRFLGRAAHLNDHAAR